MESKKSLDEGDLSKTNSKKNLGKLGEEVAAGYLESLGFRVLIRNFRAGRMGEVDIIACEREYICFIEVKTRTGNIFGTPGEAVDRRKQENLRRLAWTYLKQNGLAERDIRFDIVEVEGLRRQNDIKIVNINLIRNAF